MQVGHGTPDRFKAARAFPGATAPHPRRTEKVDLTENPQGKKAERLAFVEPARRGWHQHRERRQFLSA
jgi:hypothetical protein